MPSHIIIIKYNALKNHVIVILVALIECHYTDQLSSVRPAAHGFNTCGYTSFHVAPTQNC